MFLSGLWNTYPFISRMLAAITVGTGALVGAAQAWPLVEPWLAAHRGYVREHAAEEAGKLRIAFEPTRAGLYDIQISLARNRRASINHQIISIEIDVPKSDTAAELIKRRQQLEQLKEELAELDAEIKLLRTQREKN